MVPERAACTCTCCPKWIQVITIHGSLDGFAKMRGELELELESWDSSCKVQEPRVSAADRLNNSIYTPSRSFPQLQPWAEKQIAPCPCPRTTRSWRLDPSASRSTASIKTAYGSLSMADSTESRVLLGELPRASQYQPLSSALALF